MIMQSIGKFVFLGIKQFEGKKEKTKGQIFHSMTLLQGAETYDVMLDADKLEMYRECGIYDQLELEVFSYVGSKFGVPNISLRVMNVLKIIDHMTGEIIDLSPEIPPSDEKKSEEKGKLKAV